MDRLLQYVTLGASFETEIDVKKSRFIAASWPILTVQEVQSALENIHTHHKAANHHCFAYSVGLGVPQERFSDDGEPSGTAGRPILEVIRRQNIRNVLVVVTRYFGGTLLGASGLVRAYTDAAAQVLSHSPLLTCRFMHRLDVTCEYSHYGKVEYELTQQSFAMLDKTFTDVIDFGILVSPEELTKMIENIMLWTNGNALTTEQPGSYVGVRPDGSFLYDVWPHVADSSDSSI